MKAKHTPGPWPVITGPIKVESSSYIVAIQADNPHLNVKVHGPNKQSCAANARLIAAAPDLLEMCKYSLELIKIARQYFPKSIQNSNKFELENTCAAIAKAIKKATGDERDA